MIKIKFKRFSVLLPVLGLFSLPLMAAPAADRSSGDVVQVREEVRVPAGETRKNILALFGSIHVEGTVTGSAVSVLGDVFIAGKGSVGGDAVSIGGKILREGGGIIKGREISLGLPLDSIQEFVLMSAPVMVTVAAAAFGIAAILSSIGFLAIIILVLVLFESQVERASQELADHPFRSFFMGVGGFACVLPILTFLTLTLIGIPLAFLAAAVMMAAIVVGIVAVAHWIGTVLARRFKWRLQSLWIGLAGFGVLVVISLVPIIGWFVRLGVLFFGLGVLMLTRFRGREKDRA